jgi:hypothetical protein
MLAIQKKSTWRPPATTSSTSDGAREPVNQSTASMAGPRDIVDGAARTVDPLVAGLSSGEHAHGVFFKGSCLHAENVIDGVRCGFSPGTRRARRANPRGLDRGRHKVIDEAL